MPRVKFSPRKMPVATVEPFLDAEEAWFWFVRCQVMRREGVKFKTDGSATTRPCEPDDLYRAVMDLKRNRQIGNDHIRVLTRYGLDDVPPDPRIREQERAFRLWDEALDQLTTILKKKGIVE